MISGLEGLTDTEVEAALLSAARAERESIAQVLRCLVEFGEVRRLHGKRAYPSLFEYCTKALGYSEDEAFKRTRVAAAAKTRPELLDLLEGGKTNLSKLVVVAPHLETGPAPELLKKACTMSKRDLEFYVAGLAPKTITRDSVRMLPVLAAWGQGAPASTQGDGVPEPSTPMPPPNSPGGRAPPPSSVEAMTQELARIALTVDRATVEKYDRACALLRVRRSDGGRVFAKAIDALLREIDPERKLAGEADRKSSLSDPRARRIPRHVRAAVWKRDGGRCAYRNEEGDRCCARVGLQFDHIRPWSLGGRSDDPANLRLLCPLHNGLEARRWFGDAFIDRKIAARRAGPAGPREA